MKLLENSQSSTIDREAPSLQVEDEAFASTGTTAEETSAVQTVRVVVDSSDATVSTAVDTITAATPHSSTIERVGPKALKAHPRNVEVYGDEALPQDFLDAIRNQGILEPLLAMEDGTLLSGHQRHKAAVQIGFKTVPVIYVHPADENEALEILLGGNRQRKKNNEQLAREFKLLKEVEAAKAKKRQATKTAEGQPVKSFTQAEKGKAGDKAAKQIGQSRPTAARNLLVVQAIDRLLAEKRKNDAADLREALNKKSINAAYKLGRAREFIEDPKPRKANAGATKTAPTKTAPAHNALKKAAPPAQGQAPEMVKPAPDEDIDSHIAAMEKLQEIIRHLESVADLKKALSEGKKQEWSELATSFFDALSELDVEPDIGIRMASGFESNPDANDHNLQEVE